SAIFTPDWSYCVDQSYAIMMSQSFYQHCWGLVDSQNRPLMDMSADAIDPRDRLLGRPVIINNDLASFGAGNVPAIAGACRHSLIRNVGGCELRTLRERFLYDKFAIGIAAWKRSGYRCVNPKAFCAWQVHA